MPSCLRTLTSPQDPALSPDHAACKRQCVGCLSLLSTDRPLPHPPHTHTHTHTHTVVVFRFGLIVTVLRNGHGVIISIFD